ncbi:MAG: glycosyltransferase, partial [Thermovirgaceae bacterium]|nr:glycosyltransferase [Thermovirgaceae bacterium]
MNICMFTNTYLPHVGGVARSVASFAEDLRKLGYRVQVVAPTFANEDGSQAEEEDDVLRVPAIQNFNGSDFSVRIALPYIIDDKIDESKPEVIHSHHPFLLGDAAFRAAFRRDLPLVFTHHTLYEQYIHYVSPESESMEQLAINLATQYANLCTLVIAPSESIARLITERGVISPIEVIPTGVDVEYFKSGDGKSFRRLFDIPMNARVIGHLGRLAPEKNLEYLCEAVIKALKKMPDETRFLVVGTGPSDSRIQEMFQKEGLEDRLIMAGSQSGRKLADAYNAMDLFVFSSKSETQGMVLTEAMAASTPVIALD